MKDQPGPYRIEARDFPDYDTAERWAEQESYRTGKSVYVWYQPKRTVTEINVKYKRREIAERYNLTWVENPQVD
jgi:hypothetical protein